MRDKNEEKKPEKIKQRGPRGEVGRSTAGDRLRSEHRKARRVAGDQTPLREHARALARGGDPDAQAWLRAKGLA